MMKETGKNIEIVRVNLSTNYKSDLLIDPAIVPPNQSVNAPFHSWVNPGLRRYRNVVITKRQTWSCVIYRQCIYNDNSKEECTLL